MQQKAIKTAQIVFLIMYVDDIQSVGYETSHLHTLTPGATVEVRQDSSAVYSNRKRLLYVEIPD
jgi:hypothetical protein